MADSATNNSDYENTTAPQMAGGISEKASYAVGFSALLIALFPYKDIAQKIIIDFFGFQFSIYQLTGVFLLLLFLSIYLYGLNYIRYDFTSILNFKPLRHLELLARLFYMLAFIFPILILFSLLMIKIREIILSFIIYDFIPFLLPLIPVISSTIATLAVIKTFSMVIEEYQQRQAELSNEFIRLRMKLTQSLNNQPDNILIFNLYELIMTNLRTILAPQTGLIIKQIPDLKIIEIAERIKILTRKNAIDIFDLRYARNQIVHSNVNENYNFVIDYNLIKKARDILNKLQGMQDTKKSAGGKKNKRKK